MPDFTRAYVHVYVCLLARSNIIDVIMCLENENLPFLLSLACKNEIEKRQESTKWVDKQKHRETWRESEWEIEINYDRKLVCINIVYSSLFWII